jgi:hypothetical protein
MILQEYVKSFIPALSGASQCYYGLPMPEQENNMIMEIVNELLGH